MYIFILLLFFTIILWNLPLCCLLSSESRPHVLSHLALPMTYKLSTGSWTAIRWRRIMLVVSPVSPRRHRKESSLSCCLLWLARLWDSQEHTVCLKFEIWGSIWHSLTFGMHWQWCSASLSDSQTVYTSPFHSTTGRGFRHWIYNCNFGSINFLLEVLCHRIKNYSLSKHVSMGSKTPFLLSPPSYIKFCKLNVLCQKRKPLPAFIRNPKTLRT